MGLAVFDLDGTLLRGNSSFAFCSYLIQKKVIPWFAGVYAAWNYCCHHYGNRSLPTLHEKIFLRLLRGRSFSSIEDHVAPFLSKVLPGSCYRPAVEALRRAQHVGDFTMILSNSPSFLVEAVAAYFGVDEWRSSEYALDENRRLCHIASLMQGPDKAKYVQFAAKKLGVAFSAIKAYSDSFLDLPLLEAVGSPIAVKPDRKLHAISLQNQWQVI